MVERIGLDWAECIDTGSHSREPAFQGAVWGGTGPQRFSCFIGWNVNRKMPCCGLTGMLDVPWFSAERGTES